MEAHIKWLDTLCAIFFATILAATLAVVGIIYISPHDDVAFDNEPAISRNLECYLVTGGVEIPITLPGRFPTDENGSVTIRYYMPTSDTRVYALCMRSSHQIVRAYADEESIYSFGADTDKIAFGTTPGSCWNILRPPVTATAVTIKLTAVDPFYNGYVGELFAGTKAGIMFHLFHEYALRFVLTALIFFTGLAILIINAVFRKSVLKGSHISCIGWFSILVSIWLLCEGRIVQFTIGNSQIIYFMAFSCLSLFIVPYLRYISALSSRKYKIFYLLLTIYVLIESTVIIVLQVLGIVEFFEIVNFIIITRVIVSVLASILMFMDRQKNNNAMLLPARYGAVVLAVAAAFEAIRFFAARSATVGEFFTFGMLIFITILTTSAVRRSIKIATLSKEAERFEKLARHDLMTKCHNRTAFIQDIDKLDMQKLWHTKSVIAVDINKLKMINDLFGHHMGDDAIVRCSNCINQLMEKIGMCYRIGGDEFVCIINILDKNELEMLRRSFHELCKVERRKCAYPFECAVGFATPQGVDSCMDDVVSRADADMYLEKNATSLPVGK